MNCPSCGAPMGTENGVFQCDYCNNIIVPERDKDGVSVTTESEDDTCPICAIPLMKATLDRHPLLYCTKCDGMAIAMEEFEGMIAASRAGHPGLSSVSPANPDELHRAIACPHCHRPMDAHFYGGPGDVVIDTCESCSLNWLDHGELSRIAQAPISDFPADKDSDSDSDGPTPNPETSTAALAAAFYTDVWKATL